MDLPETSPHIWSFVNNTFFLFLAANVSDLFNFSFNCTEVNAVPKIYISSCVQFIYAAVIGNPNKVWTD